MILNSGNFIRGINSMWKNFEKRILFLTNILFGPEFSEILIK